jgi:thermitase
VGVIDEGIDVNHPELRGNIWTNPGEVAGNGIDDDRNGYVDDNNGYDFANNDATVYDPDPISGKGDEHGTHVAGTIAAVGNNGIGVTGVNWDAQVASLKFLGTQGGYVSDAVEAVNYAVAEGMDISNNSWGIGSGRSQALEDAIRRADNAGHIFIAAAGNGGSDGVGDNNDATPEYPASYELPNVVSVAASNDTDRLASFSNFGATSVDLAAPGVGILSTLPGGYGRFSGTSMATPHVAGVAALIKSQDPGLDDAQVKAKLLRSVDQKASLQGEVATNGRLNAVRPLTENTEEPLTVATADTTKPRVSSPRPAPGGSTRDRTPNIAATVTDAESELRQGSIKFSVDGNPRSRFSYDTGTDRLTYTPPRLAYGRHTAEVVAKDDAGNTTTYTWGFKVVR